MGWNDSTQKSELEINGLRLQLTCGACPEQYDVFQGEKQVGYLRLRHGVFTAEYPCCGGELVYETDTMSGDGIFEPDERMMFLQTACDAILEAMSTNANCDDDGLTPRG